MKENFRELTGTKVLITGSTGYIGSNLLRRLKDLDCKIFAPISELSFEKISNTKTKSIQYISYDGTYESLKELEDVDIDYVFHLAAYQGDDKNEDDINQMIDSNFRFGFHVLQICKKVNPRLFINTDSYFQFDDKGKKWPRNIYSITKQAFSDILESSGTKNFKICSLVLFDVYGPKDPRNKIFTRLEKATLNKKEVLMTKGEQEHYCVHVIDVVNAYCQVVKNYSTNQSAFKRYWVAGKGLSLKKVIDKWMISTQHKPRILWGELEYFPNQILKPHIGEKIPGWKIQIKLEEGLKSTLK
tara:strand:- start:9259 stop:10158 length:900 start_codon:yes stop_codon:yes gene_type:complete